MSWIFGALAAHMRPELERRLATHHAAASSVVTTPHVYLALGGIAETHAVESLDADGVGGGWCVAGMGMAMGDGGCRLLAADDWRAILAGPGDRLGGLDGHYIAMRWNGDSAQFFCDPIGLRTLYVALHEGMTLFSTRLDWLARAVGGCEIELERFGAHWLLANQMTPSSMVRSIDRLGPGARARCTPGTVDITNRPWAPTGEPTGDPECIAAMRSFLNPALPPGKRLSLGLSGGFDSRLLLALLADAGHPFSTYVIGDDGDPDVRVSKAIARHEKLEQLHLDNIIPDPASLVALLEDYAAESCAVEPAHTALKIRYGDLYARDLFVVDGGMAEIGRRQFLKRLATAGRGAMRSGRPEEIMPYLTVHRAAMMEPGAAEAMRRGALADLEAAWAAMPSVASIGEENFADLLIVRARYPNYAGRGQSRSDASAVSYMPFAQPTLINLLMRLPIERRRNARLLTSIIRAKRPSLAKFPVVKSGAAYRLGMPPAAVWAYAKVMAKLGRTWRNEAPFTLLALLEEYVRDTVASRSVREYAPYDYPRIARMVEEYYAGERGHAAELNWWLVFDIWRRGLSGT